MKSYLCSALGRRGLLGSVTLGLVVLGLIAVSAAVPPPLAVRDPRVSVRWLGAVADPSRACRLAKDPRDQSLYYLTLGGGIYRLEIRPGEGQSVSHLIEDSRQHGETNTMGFDIGPEGTFYLVANRTSRQNDALTSARILRGERIEGSSARRWSLVARTAEYGRSKTAFDHVFNAVEVSPDGATLLLNSGSRTDHGEIQSAKGIFPGLREDPLTSAIFRVPASANELFLPRDLVALKAAGLVFCEGIRNTFDLRFSPEGELFGAENGPDRHMSDELNWLREGRHYGFPWRMGGADNPQQFPDYDPALDKLLDTRFTAVKAGHFYNDPTFPPAPAGMTEPIRNLGPDADKFRNPVDGEIKDASDLGVPMFTFSSHRSPLGVVFDETRTMAAPYRGDAFVLGYMDGDENGAAYAGPFMDASEDLLHLRLSRVGDNYEATVTKVVTGFNNPIDTEVIGQRIYVISYGVPFAIWEITMPVSLDVQLSHFSWTPLGYSFAIDAPRGGNTSLQISSNLVDWSTLWTSELTVGTTYYLDGSADLSPGARFYRTLSPASASR